jgi:hypothetical protein
MQVFSLFVSYLQNPLSGTWSKMAPVPFDATSEQEAARTATALADVLYPEFASELLIRVVAEYDPGRPIAEIRRPKEQL